MKLKNKKTGNRLAGILLTLIMLVLSTAMPVQAQSGQRYFEEVEHTDPHYSEMEYSRYESAEFKEKMQEMQQLAETTGNGKLLCQMYDERLEDIYYATTMYTLIDIRYYTEPENEEVQEEHLYMSLQLDEIYDSFQSTVRELLESSYGKELERYLGEDVVGMFLAYVDMTQEQMDLSQLETELIQEYYELDPDDFRDEADYNKQAGGVFLELKDCREELLRTYNYSFYDNYGKYAFRSIYNRDYSLNTGRNFCNMVKKELVPLLLALEDGYSNDYLTRFSRMKAYSTDEILKLIGDHIGDISYELEDAWRYLTEHGLYDIEASQEKLSAGFTISLPYYNTAFIFDSPRGDPTDIETMIHEFGHFSDNYFDDSEYLYRFDSMDLNEIHSQGLEALFLEYYPDMFGDNAQAMEYNWIYYMIYGIVYNSYIAELEMDIYAEENITLEEINRLSKKLRKEYGIDYNPGSDEDYDWVYSSHIVVYPMYSFSYPVSAMAALDIWQKSLTDRDDAVSTYLNILSFHSNESFEKVLGKSGVEDIFDDTFAAGLSDTIAEYLGITEQLGEYRSVDSRPSSYIWYIGTGILLTLLAVLIILIILYARSQQYTNVKKERIYDNKEL